MHDCTHVGQSLVLACYLHNDILFILPEMPALLVEKVNQSVYWLISFFFFFFFFFGFEISCKIRHRWISWTAVPVQFSLVLHGTHWLEILDIWKPAIISIPCICLLLLEFFFIYKLQRCTRTSPRYYVSVFLCTFQLITKMCKKLQWLLFIVNLKR